MSTVQVAFIHKETGQRARFAFYASSAYDQTTFRTPPILNYVAGCMLWTTRLRLLRPVLENSLDRPVLWGSVLFGHAVTATSVKFPALATIRGMSRHLESVRQNFSDAEEKTLVLYFQNDKLDVDVCDAICKVFRGATAVLGAPTSLTLDVKPFVTDLQQDAGDWTSPRLLTAVLVVVLGFR
ncbi:hypothetical protein V5799_004189 [Amblyomma americanum]|uniref:Uncharacterized protein n=1 Tax=Amblyomma americanum TaxID=6943 RepID=A0AAQ4D6T9_AMBAM